MEVAVKAGKIKSIAISNFNKNQIERVVKNSRIKPSNLQVSPMFLFHFKNLHSIVEKFRSKFIHSFRKKDLIKYCHENDIAVTAYSPLANNASPFSTDGRPNLLNEPRVVGIGRKHSKVCKICINR